MYLLARPCPSEMCPSWTILVTNDLQMVNINTFEDMVNNSKIRLKSIAPLKHAKEILCLGTKLFMPKRHQKTVHGRTHLLSHRIVYINKVLPECKKPCKESSYFSKFTHKHVQQLKIVSAGSSQEGKYQLT